MNGPHDADPALGAMIADYMENGFLDNIIDMFRHDSGLYRLVGELIQDERVRVRIGITAMMEELRSLDGPRYLDAVPVLLPLLDHDNPVVRGDATNILGIIGDGAVLPALRRALEDEDPNVRLIAREAIEEIRQRL
jgi:HEAT repeat protein